MAGKDNITPPRALEELQKRIALTEDDARLVYLQKRRAKGESSARENLEALCDPDSFCEYGQFAVAAQRQRKDYSELQTATAADGIITGTANINSDLFSSDTTKTVVIINDYSVLAGTQGYYHHLKLDRALQVAAKQNMPVIMYTEGGGGRPGDTDVTTVNSGLQCQSFSTWAGLYGRVPRIAVNHGYCFAGNAALFGAADITIATRQSYIGMAGPAMIEGGGLGKYNPSDIGPADIQAGNGVIDILVENEQEASQLARKCLGYFQGSIEQWHASEQEALRHALPDDRRFTYDIRKLITILADEDSFTELGREYGGAIVTGFMRLEGKPVGLMASDCKVLSGAIDVAAGEKAARFMAMCEQFSLPLVSLCDTPGFMVGPDHEAQGAVRKLSGMFVQGARLSVPLVAVVLRKCYGLGAQALLGGSTAQPLYTLSWPTGEFGPMGLEGAVTLGFKKELQAVENPEQRQALYNKLLSEQYARGSAIEVASTLEIDAVIDPADTRKAILSALT